jgi:hypothetical protein
METTIELHKLHPCQQTILNGAKRFNVVKCGRRFGKTELTKDLGINPMLDGFPVGYWTPTYKDLDKVWDEINYTCKPIIADRDSQLKKLKLITGGSIDMWSMEDPDSGRGFSYKRAIMDECEKGRNFKKAWENTIIGTLADYSGDAWMLSTPKFGNTYFKEIFKYPLEKPDWMSWSFTSYDNPFLPNGEIDNIKAQIPDIVFRCEYMAEDVSITDNLWAFSFNREKHLGIKEPDKSHYIYLSFDFNVNPICCSVIQNIDNVIYVLETIALSNSNIHALCDVIKVKYTGFSFIVTGDASGNSRSAITTDITNYYTIIQNKLNIGIGSLRVPRANPALEDNQVLVNSILEHYPVKINPEKAKKLIFDFENVRTTPDGKIEKETRSDITQQADALDTFRYYCNAFHWDFLQKYRG